jgi:hypothetical protein
MTIRRTRAQLGAKPGSGKGDEALHLGLGQTILAMQDMDRQSFWLIVVENQPE